MRGAVMIIGSLLWDESPQRVAWRQSRLRANEAIPIEVPLRYGRTSQSRGNTMTMVIDPTAPQGRALLVPFRNVVSDIASLSLEARSLWAAESLRPLRTRVG